MKHGRKLLILHAAMALALCHCAQAQVLWNGNGQYRLDPHNPPQSFAIGNSFTSGYALDVHGEQMNPPLGDVFKTDAPGHTDTYWRMFQQDREFGNLFHLDQTSDFNINATQGYLRFHTNTIDRMRLTPTLIGQTIGTYNNENLSGNLGIGLFNSANVLQPFSLLHLDNGGTQYSGYRPWFRPGMTITNGSDLAWIGLKNEGGDINHLTLAWADNTAIQGPDLFKVVFLANPTTMGTAGSLDGLETMRILPANTGLESFFGIGDWFTAGTNPTERLDVLDGRVRIQQLPDDVEADQPYKVMVVDDSPFPSPERGVVKWANLPVGTDCDWLVTPQEHVVTAYSGMPCVPDDGSGVGIGNNSPKAKLDVVYTGNASHGLSGNLALSSVFHRNVGGCGINGYAAPWTSFDFASGRMTGILGSAANSEEAIGVRGEAANFSSSISTALYGLYGSATGNGHAVDTYGVYGAASGSIGGGDWAGWFQGNVMINGNGFLTGMIPIVSDASLKTSVQDLDSATTILQQLQPRTYEFLVDEHPELALQLGPQMGFIAQEVEQVLPQLVKQITVPATYDSTGAQLTASEDIKTLNYVGLIPLLVAGMQEQQTTIAQLQAQIDQCCAAQNPGMAPGGNGGMKSAPAKEDVQEQRLMIQPNPFTDHTTLSYYVPQAGKVSLQVSTSDGKPMGTLREEQAEAGAYTYEWNTSKLASGTYFCTFMLDGAVVVKRAVKVAR